MSTFIIRPDDLVVCIDAALPTPLNARVRACRDRLIEGEQYRVAAVVWLYGEKGLHLEGKDHTPTDGWRACRFRKVEEASCNFQKGASIKPENEKTYEVTSRQ